MCVRERERERRERKREKDTRVFVIHSRAQRKLLHLDLTSHCQATPGTNRSDRWDSWLAVAWRDEGGSITLTTHRGGQSHWMERLGRMCVRVCERERGTKAEKSELVGFTSRSKGKPGTNWSNSWTSNCLINSVIRNQTYRADRAGWRWRAEAL